MKIERALLATLIAVVPLLTGVTVQDDARNYGDAYIGKLKTTPPTTNDTNGNQVIPSTGAWSDPNGTQNKITQLYPAGRSDATKLNTLMQAGVTEKNNSVNCAATDLECQARNFASQTYDGTGNPYSGTAKALRGQMPTDPLAILNMGVPDANNGSVCVETQTALADTTEPKTCIQSQFKSLSVVTRLPATNNYTYTQSECLDPTYTLSADLSTCSKTTYSCPNGGTLNGVTCSDTQPPVVTYSYTSPSCAGGYTMTADRNQCNQTTYSCPAGSTLNGTTCTSTYPGTVSYGTANCAAVALSGISLWGDGVTTTISPSCNSSGLSFTSNATGSVGSEFTDYGSISFSSNYTNHPIAALAPVFKRGVRRQVGAFVSGGCNGTTCSYTVKANYVAANTAWQTYTGCTGFSRNKVTSTYYKQHPTPTSTYSTSFTESYAVTSSTCRTRTKSMSFPRLSPGTNLGSQVISFADPRSKTYSCNAGDTLSGTTCVHTFPATATTSTVSSGCLGGETKFYWGGDGRYYCRSTQYTCQAGYVMDANGQCQLSYPATSNTDTVQAGCYAGQVPAGGTYASTTFTTNPVNPITLVASGFDDTNATQAGFYAGSTLIRAPYRGWNFIAINPVDMSLGFHQGSYDLFGLGASAAAQFLGALQNVPNGYLIAIATYDEPSTNFHTETIGLKDYLVNVLGANRTRLDQIGWRTSYGLLTVKGGSVIAEGANPQFSPAPLTLSTSGRATCETLYYTCPTGTAVNGSMCEDTARPVYSNSTACVNLGYDPNAQEEVFYCDENGVDECQTLPPECTEKSQRCLYFDEVVGSPTQGQCLAWEKTLDCPVTGRTITTQSCNFDPMCFNGDCFVPNGKQCDGVFETIVKPVTRKCSETVPQTINSCGITLYMDANGVQQGKPANDCDVYKANAACMQIAIRKDADGNFPSSVYYSCLGAPTNTCASEEADLTCQKPPKKTCIQYEDLTATSGATVQSGRCLDYQVEYNCQETYSQPGDECTQDMARSLTAMEISRESADTIDPANVKVFAGDIAKCDVNRAGFLGGGFGDKSCCTVQSPDPINDYDLMKEYLGYSDISVFASDVKSVSSLTYDILRGKANALTAISAVTAGASLYSAWETAQAAYDVGQALQAGSTLTDALNAASFSPWGLAVSGAIAAYSSYQAQLACDEMDYLTTTSMKGDLCYHTKSYCEQKECGIFGCVCKKFRNQKCCYTSVLARIINEQGKRQLGVALADDVCDGFTTAQIEALNWDQIDLTEFVNKLIQDAQARMPNAAEIQQGIQVNQTKMSGSTQQLTKSY